MVGGEHDMAGFTEKCISWQGNLIWREKELEAPFRSVLELIGLIDNALSF